MFENGVLYLLTGVENVDANGDAGSGDAGNGVGVDDNGDGDDDGNLDANGDGDNGDWHIFLTLETLFDIGHRKRASHLAQNP